VTQPYRLLLNQRVPMRDGVELSTDVWLPATTSGPVPALLIRNIYNNADRRYLSWMPPFVAAGYAVVMQDCRGRHDSDGVWDPYICEVTDGFDTVEWVGTQPWCDGQVGTFGVSYPGFTQTVSAPLRNPHLIALVPIASQQDNWGHHRVSGAIHWSASLFFATLIGRTMQTEPVALLDQESFLRHLPLVTAVEANVGPSVYYRGIIEHDRYGDWWSRYSLRDRYNEVDVPAYFMTGWYDSLLRETLTVFAGWKSQARSLEARRLTRITVGPWSHQISPWGRAPLGPNGEFEDVAFGAHAVGDNIGEHLRWYDARLRNQSAGAASLQASARPARLAGEGNNPTGIDAEPPVRLFVMGRNEWRSEHEWPIARTRWTDVFLASNGGAATAEGDGRLTFAAPGTEDPALPAAAIASSDQFAYDPDDPVPSWGAQYQAADLGGPRDRREVERRRDVLVYTSDPLESELEVTGPIAVELWASTDALDTDWTGALVDVFPDGRAIILCEGICRARYRDEMAAPVLIPPNTATAFRIDCWATSNAFLPGHRIRLEISSSNFPRFDRNLNTGGRVGFETEWRVAHQVVFHDAAHPSRLILPVIPG
jgi:putative CocE/NonD family hydrolase